MLDFIWNLVLFVFSLGVLVFIHESGHFLAARLFGVKVYTFSLGFGPALYSWYGKSGIRYVISAIPLGGYVKMKGEATEVADAILTDHDNKKENLDKPKKGLVQSLKNLFFEEKVQVVSPDKEKEPDPDSFISKKVWQRFVIIAAGPIFNIILAFFLYTAANLLGVSSIKPFVGNVYSNSVMDKAQVQSLDQIKQIANKEVVGWQDFFSEAIAHVGEKVTLVVAGNFGKEPERYLTLDLSNFEVVPGGVDIYRQFGISPSMGRPPRELSLVEENSAAQKAGIQVGDVVLSVNGVQTKHWYDISSELDKYKELDKPQVVTFEIERDGKILYIEFAPDKAYNELLKKEVYHFGIGTSVVIDSSMISLNQLSFDEAVTKAFDDTIYMSMLIVRYVEKMVSGYISPKNLNGPIAIAKSAGVTASLSLSIYLSFLAAISINLGVLNLLPLPVLDGGQLVFLVYEGIFKRKPNEKLQGILVSCGMVILLMLTCLAIYNDLVYF